MDLNIFVKNVYIILLSPAFNKEVEKGSRGAFAMFLGGLTPLKFGKLCTRVLVRLYVSLCSFMP